LPVACLHSNTLPPIYAEAFLYNQIEFEVEVGQLFKTTLPCYQWVFLMHYGKMDMPNLIEKVGHTQGTLKTYKGHLRKVGILPSTNRKKPKQAN